MAAAPKGLDRLLRQVSGLSEAAASAMSDEMGEQAYELADAIEAAAPKRSGKLAASVDYCQGDPPEGSGFATGRASRSPDLKTAYSAKGLVYSVYAGSAEAYWAKWVEFGTRAGKTGDAAKSADGHYRKVKRTHPGTQAQPFFYPTVRARIPVIKRRLRLAASKATKAISEIK